MRYYSYTFVIYEVECFKQVIPVLSVLSEVNLYTGEGKGWSGLEYSGERSRT